VKIISIFKKKVKETGVEKRLVVYWSGIPAPRESLRDIDNHLRICKELENKLLSSPILYKALWDIYNIYRESSGNINVV
jgi:hypothetical protein